MHMYINTSLGLPLSARASYGVVSHITVYCSTVFCWCYNEYLAFYVASVAICCTLFAVVFFVEMGSVFCSVLQYAAVYFADVTLSIWPCVRQCVAVCCSVLHCAALCSLMLRWDFGGLFCSVLQCAAVCCYAEYLLVLAVMCCNVLHCAAVCCSVLQCVAVCCSVLQCVAVCCSVMLRWICDCDCCNVLQCVAVAAFARPAHSPRSLSLFISYLSLIFSFLLLMYATHSEIKILSHTLSLFSYWTKSQKEESNGQNKWGGKKERNDAEG